MRLLPNVANTRQKGLPLTVLKLDRVLVQDISHVARGQKLL